jgi:hypothetical protein
MATLDQSTHSVHIGSIHALRPTLSATSKAGAGARIYARVEPSKDGEVEGREGDERVAGARRGDPVSHSLIYLGHPRHASSPLQLVSVGRGSEGTHARTSPLDQQIDLPL